MYFSERDYNLKDNKELENIDKKFPIVRKLCDIFELFFDSSERLNIIECCDGYFFETLSLEELKQLSQYFLEVINYIENKNKK